MDLFSLSTRSRFNKNLITNRKDFEDLIIRNSLGLFQESPKDSKCLDKLKEKIVSHNGQYKSYSLVQKNGINKNSTVNCDDIFILLIFRNA